MELSAIPNDSGRWRADLKNWTEEGDNISWDDEGEEEVGKPSIELAGECSLSQDGNSEEDACKKSSDAAKFQLQFGCISVSVLSALLSQ